MNSNLFSNLSDFAIELLKIESIWNAVRELVLDCDNDYEVEELLVDLFIPCDQNDDELEE